MCACACVCVCVHLGEMSVEKQGTVKSELSPDGALKLTIKREKIAEDVCKPEWVTEARGSGISKLVIKRKSAASVSQSPKTTGLHVDRQTEQRPVLRLSIASSASSDRNRHVQVKSWSSYEVSSAAEDVASASELSPTCPLQQSPKDSGVDMSSPPHDDGAVGVEPSSGTGIWSVTDSHTGDSSAVQAEKMAGCLEKLETTVPTFIHADSVVRSSTKTLWPDAVSYSCESNQLKVQSTLRSRGERSVLKSLASASQKLVNPLAKPCRVGRYQHMLPVNRIRSEANVARRSSLEESPTYNMVTSRTSSYSSLPRVKTKLKLLSNNTYAPVFDQEMQRNEQHAADRNSGCLNAKKSTSEVVERRRNRRSCKSSASAGFENLKVKFCFGSKRQQRSLGDDTVQKLPKLKLVVKSEPELSVSCIEQRLLDASNTAADKQAEENMPLHVRRKQRRREVSKKKVRRSNASADSLPDVDRFSAKKVPSFITAEIRSCHAKRGSLEAKQVADWEPHEKKSKVHSFSEQPSDHPPQQSDLRNSSEEDCINSTGISTVQSICCDAAADESVCGGVMSSSSTHADELSAGQRVYDASDKAHTALQLEAGKSKSAFVDQTESSALSAESYCNGTGAAHTSSMEIDNEKHYDEGCEFHSEKCTVPDILNVNADCDAGGIDRQHAEKLSLPDDSVCVATEEMPTVVEHDSAECIAARDDVLVPDKPCMTVNSVSADDRLTKDATSDQASKSYDMCAVFDENSVSCTVEHLTVECTDTVVPSLSSPNGDSVAQNSELLQDSDESHIDEAEDSNLTLTLNPAVVTEDTLSCVTVHSESDASVVNNICPVDSVKLDSQVTVCQQNIKQEVVDTKGLCEKNFEFTSVCALSDEVQKPNDGYEQIVNDPAYLFDIPSHLSPLPAPCYSKEQKETSVTNSVCSNGFLAAFAQFVKKVSVKKKSARCKVKYETVSTSESTDEIPLKPASSQKCVRKKSFPSQRRRSTCLERHTARENRSPCHVVDDGSINTVECVCSKVASSPETGVSEDIDCSQRLAVVEDECSALSREELVNVVAAHCQLMSLRHRVCELIETILPDCQFPSGFRQDSASVERFVQDIIDVLSDSEAQMEDVCQCSDPVVTLHHMPDRCLQSLQRQVIRLLPLLLPVADLSDINSDSLDVFLELMTSINRPLSGTFCASQPNLHIIQETSLQPSNKLQLQGQLSSPYHGDTDSQQIDTLQNRPEGLVSAVDTLFNMPNSLLQINSPGPIAEKRSIRRQVKDCLMLLDRDLT